MSVHESVDRQLDRAGLKQWSGEPKKRKARKKVATKKGKPPDEVTATKIISHAHGAGSGPPEACWRSRFGSISRLMA